MVTLHYIKKQIERKSFDRMTLNPRATCLRVIILSMALRPVQDPSRQDNLAGGHNLADKEIMVLCGHQSFKKIASEQDYIGKVNQ